MKTAEREWARDLRRHRAMSVKEIARTVGVAPSSVSVWVRDIALSADQLSLYVNAIRPTTHSFAERMAMRSGRGHGELCSKKKVEQWHNTEPGCSWQA